MFFPKNLADALRTPILYRRATRGRRGGRPPLFFLKIKKSALILEKKGPDCVHPCVKFAI